MHPTRCKRTTKYLPAHGGAGGSTFSRRPSVREAAVAGKHAISILIKDHDKIKDLFDRFEKSESSGEKEKLIAEALTELKIHAPIEEEIFYPAVRKARHPLAGRAEHSENQAHRPSERRPFPLTAVRARLV
jgi:hypothetical protein